MDRLIELAERCEKATGDDALEIINLECDICAVLGIETGTHETPFTASLDAAMALVPEGWDVRMGTNGGAPWAQCKRARPTTDCHNGDAQTLPLALCAAALRAGSQSTPDILRSDD